MKNRKNIKRKLNNKGLTLIEILIAMTLLTIAIVPMMRGFIQVNRYGEKGRNLQQATTIAQTAMENCKAYNVADIHTQMTGNNFFDSGALYMAGAQYYNNGTGEYYIDNMTVDGRKVGMSVKLNAIPATRQDITNYENCNERLDGIFVASKTEGIYPYNNPSDDKFTYDVLEEKYFQDYLEKIADYLETQITQESVTISADELRADIFGDGTLNEGVVQFKRTITIKASTDSSGYDQATVTYDYDAIGSGTYKRLLTDGTMATVDLSSTSWTINPTTTTIYKNANSKTQGGKLERIYFYYYPAYNSGVYTANPCVEDKIIIDTESFKLSDGTLKNLDVYLIKQKSPAASDLILELAESDMNYKNLVDVKTCKEGSAAGAVNLYHNFKLNLGDGSDLTWPETNELNVESGCICNDKGQLVLTEEKELMYTITIKMYTNPVFTSTPAMQMTGEEILTLDGTKINW